MHPTAIEKMARSGNSSAVRGGSSSSGELFALPQSSETPAAMPEMPFLDLGSEVPLPDVEKLPAVSPPSPAASSGGMFWLEGDALMCACPDCSAPMSVRLWLMIAECWRCGTIIELSQEQEREAMRLVQEREQAMKRASEAPQKANPAAEPRSRSTQPSAAPAAQPAPTPARDKQSPRPQSPPPAPQRERSALTPPPTPERRRPAPAPPPALPTAAAQLTVIGTTGVWLRDAFRDMPAWMMSLIIHLVMLTLLGLLTYGEEEDNSIVLSTIIRTDIHREGEDLRLNPTKDPIFDLPVPDKFNKNDPQQREVLMKADQDARELRIDPNAIDPQLPELSQVKLAIGTGGSAATPLIARDPRVRVEMVKKEGGTTMTEAAVSRGLRWLALNQHQDGRWKLQDLPHASGGQGHLVSDTAATSLALLPFLGSGQTHLVGMYKDNVAPGLRFLIQEQKPDGDLRGNSQAHSGMYAHGQSAIVLCEAYAMTHDEKLKEPAQKALDFIVAAQHPGGGWRYTPGEAGDTSVVGWQLMALKSGRAANLKVPDATLELADQYLDSVSTNRRSQYAYQRNNQPNHVMTAEALLCRIYLGWKKDMPGLENGIDWLVSEHLPRRERPDIYYWYYGTQTMHHYGGPKWEQWNLAMRDILVSTQEKAGKNAGSWPPMDNHSQTGGRIYTTSLAVCTLEVYYRHLPVFKQIELEEPKKEK
jgi:hypothetical protein